MKKLIMFLLVHVNPNAIFCQVADTTVPLREFNWSAAKPTSEPFYTGVVVYRLAESKPDTLRSILLVTGKPPAFTHAVYGYCVRKNGACIAHLDSRQRLFKLPVRVWGCEGIYPKK